MHEHTVEILWAGNAGSKQKVADALLTTARERDPGINILLMSVPEVRLRDATNLIVSAGGRILNVFHKNV